MGSEQKTGSELAELRVKRRRRELRKNNENQIKGKKQKEKQHIEACLIGELKAAQSNSRNNKVKDKEREFEDSVGLRSHFSGSHRNYRKPTERPIGSTIGSLIDRSKNGKNILNHEEQFKVNKIMSDASWGQRTF